MLSVPFVLGLNGNAVTMRPDLARRVGEPGKLGDPARVGAALRVVAQERPAIACDSAWCIAIRATTRRCATGSRPAASAPITTWRSPP